LNRKQEKRFWSADQKRFVYSLGKVAKLLSYAGSERDISDPWYTGDFGTTYDDVLEGCTAFLEYLQQNSKIDT